MGRITGWIVYPKYVALRRDNAFEWLVREAKVVGIDLEILFIEDIVIGYGNGPFLTLRGSIPAGMPHFVVMRAYETAVSRFFENAGIPVINSSRAMESCKNKMLTHELLSQADIPTPLTIYNESAQYDYNRICALFGASRFIVKQIDGAKGENVYLVKDTEEMRKAINGCNRRCICQKFVEESYGRDVRVWIIGGRVTGSVLRYSDSSFLSNFSQGGKVSPFSLPAKAAELAIRSAATLGTEFAGIDLLFTDSGFTVNEVNGNAGFRTLSQIGDNNIPQRLFQYIKSTYF